MELLFIEEPKEIKKYALQKVSECKIIDRESIIAMYTSSSSFLPKYLWKYWSKELKDNGISWQVFLRVCGRCKREAIDWVEGKINWRELLKKFKSKFISLT